MSRRIAIRCLFLLAWFAAPRAHALCVGVTVVTGTPVQFLFYDPVSASPLDATGLVTVGCAGLGLLPAFTVSLNIGTGGGTLANRRLLHGTSDTIRYNLYTEFARTNIWGDGTSGTKTQSFDGVLSLGTIPYTVYGRIPISQDKPSGTYSSTVTITLDF